MIAALYTSADQINIELKSKALWLAKIPKLPVCTDRVIFRDYCSVSTSLSTSRVGYVARDRLINFLLALKWVLIETLMIARPPLRLL